LIRGHWKRRISPKFDIFDWLIAFVTDSVTVLNAARNGIRVFRGLKRGGTEKGGKN